MKYSVVFGNNPNISIEERDRVVKELEKIGSLTFKVEKFEEGWYASCKEVPSILAGNDNPNPSQSEINKEIRSAIYTAFAVECAPAKVKNKTRDVFAFQYAVS